MNMVSRLILYDGKPAVIVKTGEELTSQFQTDMDDHLGVWFGDVNAKSEAVVYTIPAELIRSEPAPIAYEH